MEVLKKISVKQKGIIDKLDTLDVMQKQKIKGRQHISSGESSARRLKHSLVPPEILSARLSFYTLEKKRALLPVEQVINGGLCPMACGNDLHTLTLAAKNSKNIISPPRKKCNKTYPYLVLCCFLSFRRLVSPWKDKTLKFKFKTKLSRSIRRHIPVTHTVYCGIENRCTRKWRNT